MSTTTHYRACNLCEAICGLEIQLTDGVIDSIKPDKNDPLSQGHICPKGVALQDLQNDPDRLRKPVRRTANAWVEIDWDEAFDLVASRVAETINKYGPDAVAAYFGNPNVHNYGSLTHAQNFFGLIKTKNRYSATSVDQLPHQLAAYKLYGHQLMLAIPDIDRTQYFLVMGYNPMASNGSIMTVPNFPKRVKAMQARGGKLVVIDPRRSETAAVADEYDPIIPGSDAAFLLALIQVVIAENQQAKDLPDYLLGVDEIAEAVKAFTPEMAASVCGISAERIREIARDFAQAESAVCHPRMGCSTQQYGGICLWAGQVLNAITGNLDRPGGAMFPQPAVDLVEGPASKPGHFNQWQSRVSKRPEFSGELPSACMLEEMQTPGEGQIKALITSAGNPVLSTPNGNDLAAQIRQLEFVVSIDFYMNETTSLADVILPPTAPLEHDHYDTVFLSFAVRNVARFNEPVMEKPEGSYHDWEIFNELGQRLAKKLGKAPRMTPRPDQLMDFGLQSGRYSKAKGHPAALSLQKLKDNPSGIDLGPLQPCLPGRLQTAEKTINLADPLYMDYLPKLQREILSQKRDEHELLLIGRRHIRSNNSWLHNSQRLVKGKARDQLLMHPDDLAIRKLSDGSKVALQSRTGRIEVEVQASDEMMRGVVSLPHGWGHNRKGTRMQIAQAHAGESCNDVTDDQFVDELSGNAAVNGVAVTVSAA